jgi:hypothetical protein
MTFMFIKCYKNVKDKEQWLQLGFSFALSGSKMDDEVSGVRQLQELIHIWKKLLKRWIITVHCLLKTENEELT